MAALLFVFTQIGLFGGDTTISQSLFLSLFALVLYTQVDERDFWLQGGDWLHGLNGQSVPLSKESQMTSRGCTSYV